MLTRCHVGGGDKLSYFFTLDLMKVPTPPSPFPTSTIETCHGDLWHCEEFAIFRMVTVSLGFLFKIKMYIFITTHKFGLSVGFCQ